MELDRNGTIGVGFGGGEPTLYPAFSKLCQFATTQTGLAVSFTTHGHHLDGELINALAGNVHFIRISMDGIYSTYGKIRQRSFKDLLHTISKIANHFSFGINYLVNGDTIHELDDAAAIAHSCGAKELLLLPEVAIKGRGGIDVKSMFTLKKWVAEYSGPLRLAVSEHSSAGMPTCNPFSGESPHLSYLHISADGILKNNSFESYGIPIGNGSIESALSKLNQDNENME